MTVADAQFSLAGCANNSEKPCMSTNNLIADLSNFFLIISIRHINILKALDGMKEFKFSTHVHLNNCSIAPLLHCSIAPLLRCSIAPLYPAPCSLHPAPCSLPIPQPPSLHIPLHLS